MRYVLGGSEAIGPDLLAPAAFRMLANDLLRHETSSIRAMVAKGQVPTLW